MTTQIKTQEHPDDVMVWADGDMGTREDIDRGDYDWKSDDYRPATKEEEDEYWGHA